MNVKQLESSIRDEVKGDIQYFDVGNVVYRIKTSLNLKENDLSCQLEKNKK